MSRKKRVASHGAWRSQFGSNKGKSPTVHVQASSSYTIVAWIFFAMFALLFLLSPYQRGLFFQTEFFSTGMALQALFLLTLVSMFPIVRAELMKQWRILAVLFAIPFVYTLSFWYSYLPSTAAYEALQWFSYALLFFVLIIWLAVEKRLREGLWLLAWATMLWITGLVFLVHFGVLEYQDALLGSRRFSSVFQYPNTFAALLSVFVLVGLMNLTKRLNGLYTCLYAFSLLPFFLAFLLTQSRGALLVFAVCWALAMFFLAWREQVLYVVYSVVLVLVGFWGYGQYMAWMQEELVGQSAALLIVASVVLGLFLMAVQYLFVQRQTLSIQSKWGFLAPTLLTFLGTMAVLMAGTSVRDWVVELFPEGLQRRVASISLEEAYSRLLFFKDAVVVWKDHFFLGTGGGGWRALFESYKSLPYYSTQAHSFYMQTLVEVGLIGSLVVFGFLFYVVGKGVWFYFREEWKGGTEEVDLQQVSSRQGNLEVDQKGSLSSKALQLQEKTLLSSAIMGAVILLLHSAIDFNMSFGTYNFFLFLFLALIWSFVQDESWLSKLLGRSFGSNLVRMQERLTEQSKAMVMYSFVGVLALSSFFALYTSYAYHQAEQVQGSLSQGQDLASLVAQVDRAIAYNAHDVRFRYLKVSVLSHAYQQTGDVQWLEQIREEYDQIVAKEPTMHQHYLQYAQFLEEIGEKEEALELKLKALAVAPWQQSIYEEMIASGLAHIQEEEKALQPSAHLSGEKQGEASPEAESGSLELSVLLEKLDKVMVQYEHRLVQQVEEAPEGFRPSARIRRNYDHQLNMAQLYLYQEKYTAALEALRVFFPESWLEKEWYLDLFVEGQSGAEKIGARETSEGSGEEGLVKPFELQTLQQDLQRYLDGEHVLVLAGRDRMARHLSQSVKELLSQVGSQILNLGQDDSYVGVIVQGKMVAEEMNADQPVEISNVTHPELSEVLGQADFSFYSAGRKLGDESVIMWRGKDRSRNGRGLNIVVLDKNLNVIERLTYNTYYWDYKIILQDKEK